MTEELPVKPPSTQGWTSLTAALTWMRYNFSVEVDELSYVQGSLGLTKEELRHQLQDAWRELADKAGQGLISIRGRREGERRERPLDLEDLRNCRFLTWTPHPNKPEELAVRVERYDDIFDEQWDRADDTDGNDYIDVVVSAEGLLHLFPRPSPTLTKLRTSVAGEKAALQWLLEQFRRTEPEIVTKTKAAFLAEMGEVFKLGKTRACHVWREAVQKHPERSLPGPKSIRGSI